MSKTKRHLFGATLLLATLANSAMASQADYQSEVTYNNVNTSFDDTNDTEATTNSFVYEYYIEPVKIDEQPLQEAYFMNRVGSIAVAYGLYESDAKAYSSDGDFLQLQYTHTKSDSPLWLQFNYGKESDDYTNKPGYSSSKYSLDTTHYGIGVGYFVAKNTVAAIEYNEYDYSYSPASYSGNDKTITYTRLMAKHLIPLGNGTMLNVEGSYGIQSISKSQYSSASDNSILDVLADYYFTTHYSVGASLIQRAGDDNGFKGQEIGIHGRFFLTPKFSLNAEFTQFSADGKSTDYDTLWLQAVLRF